MMRLFTAMVALFFMIAVLTGCATVKVSEIDFEYFEQFRQPEHRLVYIASETSGIIPRGDLYVITNPADIETINNRPSAYYLFSPVYIPNHKTDGGKGLAVFSLPKEENNIHIRFNGIDNNYKSLIQLNHKGICTISKDVDDVFINVTLGSLDGETVVLYLQWYEQEAIHKAYKSCTGKYGHYIDEIIKEQLGFIKVTNRP